MNDFQDTVFYFALGIAVLAIAGLAFGLMNGTISFDLELILDSLKPFLSPTYAYDFLIEVMSRDYFINDHLIVDKTYFSLAIVTFIYSTLIFALIFIVSLPLSLLKLPENNEMLSNLGSTMLRLLLIPLVISVFFLSALIPSIFIFSIAPTLIKGFFQ